MMTIKKKDLDQEDNCNYLIKKFNYLNDFNQNQFLLEHESKNFMENIQSDLKKSEK